MPAHLVGREARDWLAAAFVEAREPTPHRREEGLGAHPLEDLPVGRVGRDHRGEMFGSDHRVDPALLGRGDELLVVIEGQPLGGKGATGDAPENKGPHRLGVVQCQ